MFDRRGYLLEVTDRAPTLRALRALVDVLAGCCYNELWLCRGMFVSDLEDDPPQVAEPKKLAAYCAMQGLDFHEITPSDYERLFLDPANVCVSTEAPRSLAGRVEEMRERMEKAEEAGRLRKAKRFLVTDLADGFAWHPPVVSLPGIVMGGNFAFSGHKAARMDLELELNRVFDVPLAGLVLKLGTLYLRGGARRDDASELFNILSHDVGYSRHPGLTAFVLDDIGGVARGVRVAAERWAEKSDMAKEVVYMANLLDAACHRRDETRLRALRDEHGRIWRLRYEPEGRVASLAKLPRF